MKVPIVTSTSVSNHLKSLPSHPWLLVTFRNAALGKLKHVTRLSPSLITFDDPSAVRTLNQMAEQMRTFQDEPRNYVIRIMTTDPDELRHVILALAKTAEYLEDIEEPAETSADSEESLVDQHGMLALV